jgi:hypothetical protein
MPQPRLQWRFGRRPPRSKEDGRSYRRLTGYLRSVSAAVGDAITGAGPADDPWAVVLAAGPWEAPGSMTPGPAGWFTIMADTDGTDFHLGHRRVRATELAQAIWRCPRWRGRPVLLLTGLFTPAGTRPGRDALAGVAPHHLAVELGAPVYAADGAVRFTYGRARTTGTFWRWRPGGELPEMAGSILPPARPVRRRITPHRTVLPPVAAAEVSRPAVAISPVELGDQPVSIPSGDAGIARTGLVSWRSPEFELDAKRPAAGSTRPKAAQPAAPPSVERPPWSAVRAYTEDADRERMRTALGWRFLAHSRCAARAMSLHPGLRNALGGHDVVSGLVAVLALLDGAGDRVNRALRGGPADEQTALLARCAAAGLSQLPVVGGAVFAMAPAELALGAYRPGEVLVEPAFAALSLTPGAQNSTPRYAIWSASARRLDLLTDPNRRDVPAMFAAGTRFAVLDIVHSGPEEAPCVLLREVVGDRRDSALDERIGGKLRAALGRPPGGTPPQLPWPLGLDEANRMFLAPPDPA